MTANRLVYLVFGLSLMLTIVLALTGFAPAAFLAGVVAYATGSVSVANAMGYNPKPLPWHLRYIEMHG